MIYKRFWKRILDVIAALILMITLSPILLIVSILIKSKLGSPVIFKQERPGKGGKIFTIYKYRTMKDAVDGSGKPLPDEERMTRFGSVLRSTSLDELPELLNILRGDMSFIGPRPLLVRYLDRYNDEQARRHEVRPGLTGYAQVNGRNAISWEKKFEYDVYYVDNVSFLLDCKIFIKTVQKVLGRSDISQDGEATMGEFMGDKKE